MQKMAKARAEWRRGDLAAWRARQTPERRAEDEASLGALFTEAVQVPLFREAHDWAREHGIEFIVDHTTTAGGYYGCGTGVVAIAKPSLRDKAWGISVLIHELRHAWQDYYGMIPTCGTRFTNYFMREALIEADATAHEKLGKRQYELVRDIRATEQAGEFVDVNGRLARLKSQLHDPKEQEERQRVYFEQWFRSRGGTYGNQAAKMFGKALGIPGVTPKNHHFEFEPHKIHPAPVCEGIDPAHDQDLRRLGGGFQGNKNYFNDAAFREFLYREALAAGRTGFLYKDIVYNYRSSERLTKSPPLIEEIRCRELRLRLHTGRERMIVLPG